jgi:hypothetical protein
VSLGTISVAHPGTGQIQVAVHACSQVGDANGTATVRLYNGINGDAGGGAVYSWTQAFGGASGQTGIAYGIYTMTITTQPNDPTKSCAVYKQQLDISSLNNNATITVPLIFLNN